MRNRTSIALLSLLSAVTVALAATESGCARSTTQSQTACTFARTPKVDDGHEGHASAAESPMKATEATPISAPASKLFDEAKRELSVMRTTTYRHETNVDEEAGNFEYDCSGFVSYALRLSAPSALDIIPVGVKGRQRAEDYVAYFSALPSSNAPSPWISVPHASDVREGDVVAWLRPDDVDNTNTGHMGIVAAPATACGGSEVGSAIGGSSEWLVRLIDSTQSPHADDVRKKDESAGLGQGTIGLVVDGSGAPIGYRWKGGVSDKAHATKIVIARLR